MTFQSLEYAVLLSAVFVVYWFLSRRYQNAVLILASYVFYSYVDLRMALLIGGYTLVTYVATNQIEKDTKNARRYLAAALIASLGTLTIFKYAGFFVTGVAGALDVVGLASFDSTLKIILPVGISFYTFQSIGYLIDVYKQRTHARTNLVDTALFISFFPQLVAGPIERASKLFPQFEQRRVFNPERISSGISLLAWGLFKKLVIADNVGMLVDNIFAVNKTSGAMLWVGVFAFGIQILADFSGYTDIARGSARILGIDLSVNFRHPWLASSPIDFWRRWHITLSEWLRDYVYIPLGGDRHGKRRTAVNVVVTFALGGLWHGAAWNFVLWGLLHAGLLLIWRGARSLKLGLPNPASAIITFIAIGASWLLFRESDLTYIGRNIFAGSTETKLALSLGVTALLYSLPLWVHALVDRPDITNLWTRNDVSRTAVYTVLTLTSFIAILALRADTSADFIYFRF
ncbi:MBOAT family O-acyltransferase [Candidatus Lucifugimonas marina]|jgi:D-alanyl-lipoteichoic acid acyltransferase DltB (MBOAT superfamily)|uniref:MBOAT family protein n=1 Tax=Candidatus Lucifugimonas marina TaxID=3038979 RepID=A0AAJ5ZJN6_9CHLR|nr:MBOAT family protein [SAR202 cluster bacterium JH702]MDG0870430.1 MBOAT family protein [SAR202 cluster bacterium JH639]WFG36018.1 MBOAT family protein [SAR202 cluster bacterium JH545]WFG39962.1 MBOAT family protein [SAR202 cluster bacterium JH1073]